MYMIIMTYLCSMELIQGICITIQGYVHALNDIPLELIILKQMD